MACEEAGAQNGLCGPVFAMRGLDPAARDRGPVKHVAMILLRLLISDPLQRPDELAFNPAG